MNLSATEFTSLNSAKQLECIMNNAVFIGERSNELFRYLLHNINGLYIEEVRFIKNNTWFHYMCVEDFDTLARYADSVEIVL